MNKTRTLLNLALPLVFAGTSFSQTTWFVDVNAAPGGNGTGALPYDTIQGGIASATTVSGDTLSVLPGQYLESIDYLTKDLTIVSTTGSANTEISGQGGSTVVIGAGQLFARLEGFEVTGGVGTLMGPNSFGGGILCTGSTLGVVDCEIRSNTANFGGGLYADSNSTITLQDTSVLSNTARAGGGLYSDSADAYIDNSTIRFNVADYSAATPGGGIYSGTSGILTVTNTVISNNRIQNDGYGGGVTVSTPSALFVNCVISGNSIDGALGFPFGQEGGGVWCEGPLGAPAQFTDCTINNNQNPIGSGGGVFGNGNFDNCTISNNAAIEGGGVYGTGTYQDCLIENNIAAPMTGECVGEGGGAYGGTFTDCDLIGNSAALYGGGARLATLTGCEVRDNSLFGSCEPTGSGAGLSGCAAQECLIVSNRITGAAESFPAAIGGAGAAYSTLIDCELRANEIQIFGHWGIGAGAFRSNLTDCLVESNTILTDDARGGKGAGVYGGTATNCQILNNEATVVPGHGIDGPSLGGGAAVANLTRCVVAGNRADLGGGAWGGSMTHCTVVSNVSTGNGGGVSSEQAIPGGAEEPYTVTNSILWNNFPDQAGFSMAGSSITYTDISGGYAGVGNISTDPLFWGAGHGDYNLRPGSPCIDAGDPGSPNDPDGSVADMGVYPFDANYFGTPDVYCTSKENSAGCVPSIGYTGTPSVTGADDFVISADMMMPNKPTIAIWSHTEGSTPFFGGTLCVAPSIVRTPPTSSGGTTGCTGIGTYHFQQSYMAAQGLIAGDRVYLQFWQRDPAHIDLTGVGLSNALDFTLIP